jgi:hypothetical protein
MSEQGKRLQRQAQEDAAFNKMLIWLAGAIVLEGVSLLIRAFYLNFTYMVGGLDTFFKVFRGLGAVLFVVGCAWCVETIRKGGKKRLPLACTGGVLWLWIVSILCYGYNLTGMVVMCLIPAVVAALAAVYFLYQREFFVCCAMGCVGGFALWVFRRYYSGHPAVIYAGFALVCAGMVAAALACRWLGKRGGKLGVTRVFAPDAAYLPVYLTAAVVVLGLAAALLLGVGAAYYVVAVLVGWLFCLAVYYTVKLM